MTAPAHARGPRAALASRLAELMAARLGVSAIALGGSVATGMEEAASDIDLYVYADPLPALADRAAVAEHFGAAAGAEIGNTVFEPGDEWRHAGSGTGIDIMYRTPGEIEDRLDAVLLRHEARLGYSTCFWHNLRTSRILVDEHGWFAGLQHRAAAKYPEGLADAIVDLNWTMLTRATNSWLVQLSVALDRGDIVSAGHRATAFLASYFDVLFAINRQPHPGEKRLVKYAARFCAHCPADLERDVAALLCAAGQGDPAAKTHGLRLLEGLAPLVGAGSERGAAVSQDRR